MLKQELEARLNYQITNDGFEELNKMYMACELDKDEFASLVKVGAKKYKVAPKETTFKGIKIQFNEWIGLYEIKDVRISLIQTYFDTIEDAKDLIKRYTTKVSA